MSELLSADRTPGGFAVTSINKSKTEISGDRMSICQHPREIPKHGQWEKGVNMLSRSPRNDSCLPSLRCPCPVSLRRPHRSSCSPFAPPPGQDQMPHGAVSGQNSLSYSLGDQSKKCADVGEFLLLRVHN